MMRLQLLSGIRGSIALRGTVLRPIATAHLDGSRLSFLRHQSQAAAALRNESFDENMSIWDGLGRSSKRKGKSQDKESLFLSDLDTPVRRSRNERDRQSSNGRSSSRRRSGLEKASAKREKSRRAPDSSARNAKGIKSSRQFADEIASTFATTANMKQSSRSARSSKSAQHDSYDYSKRLELPTQEDIPGMPSNLLNEPVKVLTKRLKGIRIVMKVLPRKDGYHFAALTVTLPLIGQGSTRFEARGRGNSASDANKAAATRMVADLHAAGVVKELWPMEPGLSKMDLEKEGDALNDVYNYCAKHLSIPKVELQRAKLLCPPRGKATPFNCTISLEEQNIMVSAVAPDFNSAEVMAARKFKAAAERHIAQSNPTEQLLVRDAGGLTLENAQQFHQWLKDGNRSYDYRLDSEQKSLAWQVQFLTIGPDKQWTPSGPVIKRMGKKKAEPVAYLCGAIAEMMKDPSLQERFTADLRRGGGKILRKASPMNLDLPGDSLALMKQTVSRARTLGLDMKDVELMSVVEPEHRQRSGRPALSLSAKKSLSQHLSDKHQMYLNSDSMAAMRKLKSELPMNQYKKEVFRLVEDNVFSIIIGATGSGKTTQVPQIILEQYYEAGNGADCEIICTQPRRIAATSVASRVKDEMGPDLQAHVGHHVRFDTRLPRQGGSVTYCTTGILLQQLQAEPDRIFDQVSHLIIDEVHERDKIIDFTLTILKKAVAQRLASGQKVPKITLMSATLDTELFANYFKNTSPEGTLVNAPILSVPGRAFPVTEKYLDDIVGELRKEYTPSQLYFMSKDRVTDDYLDYEREFARAHAARARDGSDEVEVEAVIDWKTKQVVSEDEAHTSSPQDALVPYGLVAATIAHTAKTTTDGAILVFFPGLQEMQAVEKLLQNPVLGVDLLDQTKYKIFLLHSSIPDTQKTVFSPVPEGVRKIILSTNIGETSITIPDVKYVVDTGKVRETRYDHVKRISSLESAWISKSNAKQRAGRAGRVQNGHYLALYSRSRHQSMRAIGLPELLRSDLQAICLALKSTLRGVDIREFLASAVESPSPAGVTKAVDDLTQLGALTTNEELTALGRVLASLPIHPALGKMVLLGVLFKCLDPILIIGAAAEERGLFVMAPDAKAKTLRVKRSFAKDTESEHLVVYNAFSAVREQYSHRYERRAQNFAFDNNIHMGAWKSIYGSAQQMEQILSEHGLVPKSSRFDSDDSSRLFGGEQLNLHSHKPHIVKAVLLAGLMPNMATTRAMYVPWRTAQDDTVMLPRTSIFIQDSRSRNNEPRERGAGYLATFTNLHKASDGKSTFFRDVSIVDPLTVALFSPSLDHGPYGPNSIEALGWLSFFIKTTKNERGGSTRLMDFRRALEQVQTGAFADLAHGKPLHDFEGSGRVRNFVVERAIELLDMAQDAKRDARSMEATGIRRLSFDGAQIDGRSGGSGELGEDFDYQPNQGRRRESERGGYGDISTSTSSSSSQTRSRPSFTSSSATRYASSSATFNSQANPSNYGSQTKTNHADFGSERRPVSRARLNEREQQGSPWRERIARPRDDDET